MTDAALRIYEELKIQYGVNTSQNLLDFNKNTLVISTVDFVLESPAPLMPHIMPISGLFRKPPRRLSDDLEAFMTDAGEDGIVVMSLGSIWTIENLPHSDRLVQVLSGLKQKVSYSFN